MILTFHIIIALTSLALAAYACVRPSRLTLGVAYTATVLTVLSGTYVTFQRPAHLTATCLMGLAYLALMFAGLMAARRRLGQSHGS